MTVASSNMLLLNRVFSLDKKKSKATALIHAWQYLFYDQTKFTKSTSDRASLPGYGGYSGASLLVVTAMCYFL